MGITVTVIKKSPGFEVVVFIAAVGDKSLFY